MASFDDIANDVLGAPKSEESTEQSTAAPAVSPWDTIYEQTQAAQPREERAPPAPIQEPPDASQASFKDDTLKFAIPIPGLTHHQFDTGWVPPGAGAFQKRMANIGSGLTDIGLGWDQVMGKATEKDADEKKKLDDPLNKGVLGTTLNMFGKSMPFIAGAAGGAATLPFLGGAAPIAAATAPIGYGGLQGFSEPVDTNGPGRGLNTAIGAVTAGMGPLASKLFGLGPDKVAGPLAREAADQGYKVTPADTKSSGIVNWMRNKLGEAPVIGQREGVKDFNKAKFTENVASTWGGTAKSADPKVFAQEGEDLTTQLTGMYKSNPLTITNQFDKKLEEIGNKVAASDAGRNQVKKVTDEIAGARVLDKETGLYKADGEKIQTVLEDLQSKFKTGDPKSEMNKLRRELYDTIKGEYTAKMKPEDLERFNKVSERRRAWDAMSNYVAKSARGEGKREVGNLSPDDVAIATRAMYGGETAPADKFIEAGRHILRPTTNPWGSTAALTGGAAAVAPTFFAGLPALAKAAPVLGAAGIASRAINSPLAYKVGTSIMDNPLVSKTGSLISPFAKPMVVQGALSATEGIANTQQRGRESMR
jgi:hypothetical protein